MEVVDRPADNLREQNPDSIVQEDAQRPYGIAAAVLLEIGKKRAQTLGKHLVPVDEILPVRASLSLRFYARSRRNATREAATSMMIQPPRKNQVESIRYA